MRHVVPFAAGSGTDVLMRIVANELQKSMGAWKRESPEDCRVANPRIVPLPSSPTRRAGQVSWKKRR